MSGFIKIFSVISMIVWFLVTIVCVLLDIRIEAYYFIGLFILSFVVFLVSNPQAKKEKLENDPAFKLRCPRCGRRDALRCKFIASRPAPSPGGQGSPDLRTSLTIHVARDECVFCDYNSEAFILSSLEYYSNSEGPLGETSAIDDWKKRHGLKRTWVDERKVRKYTIDKG